MMKFSSLVLFSVGCFQLTHAKQVEISEGRKRLLTCSLGQVLNIQSAKYGGSSFGCRDNDVTSIVQSQCQNKRTCMVYAEDDHYEDSCLLSNEVLTITYRCIPKDDCYYRIFGNIYYDGTISVTESGKTCQWWDDNEPHVPKYRPNSGDQRNYCRNPDGDSDRPWCYTMDPETRWEYCDIEDCDGIATSETTKSNTVSMTTTLSYSTKWQSIGTNGSVTESGNKTNVSAGESKLTNTSSDETITIVTLIAGCIFGLLLIGIITIAIFRRFREKRDVGAVLVLHMSSLSQENQRPVNNNISTHSNGSVVPSDTNVRNMPTSYFGNNVYSLQQSSTALISETTTSKYVDESEHVMDDGAYTVIEQYPTDSLPPSYDSVSRNNPSAAGHSMNVYNHAHYSADDYAKSDSMGLLQQSENLSDGYCKAASLVAESTQDGCQNDPVYENENIKCNQNGRFSKCRSHVKSDNLLQKNKTSNPSKKDKGNNDIISSTENNSPSYTKKGNQYDDIDFKTSSNKSHYQNIEDSEIEVKRQHQGYMPMEFGKGGSIDETDNVYVPIMSPISKSPPIVFDDTYQF